jgi:hypothetical protein
VKRSNYKEKEDEICQIAIDEMNDYCANDARKLHNFLGIFSKKHYMTNDDELFSIALEVLAHCVLEYKEGQNTAFATYFYNALENTLKTYRRNETRLKRIPKEKIDYLDAPISSESATTIGETIASDIDVFAMSMNDIEENSPLGIYLNRLSTTQRKVVFLLADGYKKNDIISKLNITSRIYNDCLAAIRSFNNTNILIKDRRDHRW